MVPILRSRFYSIQFSIAVDLSWNKTPYLSISVVPVLIRICRGQKICFGTKLLTWAYQLYPFSSEFVVVRRFVLEQKSLPEHISCTRSHQNLSWSEDLFWNKTPYLSISVVPVLIRIWRGQKICFGKKPCSFHFYDDDFFVPKWLMNVETQIGCYVLWQAVNHSNNPKSIFIRWRKQFGTLNIRGCKIQKWKTNYRDDKN